MRILGAFNTAIEAMSSGEQVVVLAVICAAISRVLSRCGDARKRVILCEADPCDYEKLGIVMRIADEAVADLVCGATWQRLTPDEMAAAMNDGWTVNLI